MEERRDIAGDETPDTDRVLTVPNALSVLRLVGVPLFLWLLLRGDDGWALVTLALSGITDYLDGKIARHFHLVSRVGQLLDPIADRLYIISTLLVGLPAGGALGAAPAVRALAVMPPDTALRSLR